MSKKHSKKESKLSYILLSRIAEEYHQSALNITSKENAFATSLLALSKHEIKQFYTLINQSIKLYTIILEKHNENTNKNFFLPVKKEIHITLKLVDLLINYTVNHKLAHIIAYKLLIKLSNSNNNNITKELYQLQFYYIYQIPMSSTTKDDAIKQKSLSNLDILLYQRDVVDRDWLLCFHLCKINYYFKLRNVKIDLKDTFKYFHEMDHYLRSQYPKMYSYIKLCEICHHLNINEFDRAESILESETTKNYEIDEILKIGFYLTKIYLKLLQEQSIVPLIKDISCILSERKAMLLKNFKIDLKINNISIQCNLFQYGVLKNLLLFVQALSKIQMTYSANDENYYQMLAQQLFKNKLILNNIAVPKTLTKISLINNNIEQYAKFYQNWQKQLLFQQKLEVTETSNDPEIFLYYEYMSLLKQDPNIHNVAEFCDKHKDQLEEPRFRDIAIYLCLYCDCLRQLEEKEDTGRNQIAVELPEYPLENKIFETTRLMIQLVMKMESFSKKSIKSSFTSMEQEYLVIKLKETLQTNKRKSDNNKVLFLEIVLLIIQTLLEDNNEDRFDKFYSLVTELEDKKVSYILPVKLYHRIITSTIDIGLKQEASESKLLFLQKLIA